MLESVLSSGILRGQWEFLVRHGPQLCRSLWQRVCCSASCETKASFTVVDPPVTAVNGLSNNDTKPTGDTTTEGVEDTSTRATCVRMSLALLTSFSGKITYLQPTQHFKFRIRAKNLLLHLSLYNSYCGQQSIRVCSSFYATMPLMIFPSRMVIHGVMLNRFIRQTKIPVWKCTRCPA
jgi:hypothetical protein